MGVSTDGILFYGYHFEDGTEFPWDNEDHHQYAHFEGDPEKWFALKRGLVIDYDAEGYDYKKIMDLEESLPARVGYHCSDEYTMYYLAVRSSEVSAARGYPKKIEFYPYRAEDWNSQLESFAKEFELPAPESAGASEIAWWLTSYWG